MTMKRFILAACALTQLTACVIIDADESKVTVDAKLEPALLGTDDPYPIYDINLRRTTLVVKDVEASLKLYRDALGFNVVYDQELTSPNLKSRYGADGKNRSRLVLTQTNSAELGMIGLWQFLDQTTKDKTAPDAADFTPGEIVLLFHTKNLKARFDAAAKIPGVTVLSPPAERRYPSPKGDIIVMVSMLTDMDGHTIELNEKIYDPREDK
jgi:catechol 2,3-dioxygenase-like lactoylglutathione lyase family enzyme